MRPLLLAIGVLLALVPAARGEAVGLRDALDAEEVALAGPDVLVARNDAGGGMQLEGVPRAGGPPRILLALPSARIAWPDGLAASADRVVVAVERDDRNTGSVASEIYSGPPSGPLHLAWRTRTWSPVLVDVSGDRALVLETPAGPNDLRAWTVDAGGRAPVPWASGALAPVAIAGDYVGVFARKPPRIALASAATGAIVASHRISARRETSVDVAPDGRLVTATRGGLLTMRPGAAPQPLAASKGLMQPLFAGTAIAAVDARPANRHIVLLRVDGSRHVLGGPTAHVRDIAADEQGVAWLANGCARYAPLTGPGPVDDPCPAVEVGLYAIDLSVLRGRTVRVRVRCVATPTGACIGTLLLKHAGRVVTRGPFTVPAGTQERVPVRLSRRGLRVARRERTFILDAEVPGGRVWPGFDNSELTVKLR